MQFCSLLGTTWGLDGLGVGGRGGLWGDGGGCSLGPARCSRPQGVPGRLGEGDGRAGISGWGARHVRVSMTPPHPVVAGGARWGSDVIDPDRDEKHTLDTLT
jgi:hypothetical protein